MNLLAQALVVSLMWTNPSTKAELIWIPPAQRDTPADSMAASCIGSIEPLTDLDSVFIYGQPAGGGPRRRVFGMSVRGKEGRPDSMSIQLLGAEWTGGHFDMTAKRINSKESCPSNRVYIGTVTAVEPAVRPHPKPVLLWYDVHGRRISDPRSYTGVVFLRWTDGAKVLMTQRAVAYRGRILSRVREP